ncbi:MAG: GatB/YqeY domain-containing protein [Anaerolineales bacterium]
MTLKEKLERDLHEAMRQRDVRRRNVLRMALSAIQTVEATRKDPLSDDEVVVLLRKEAKRREEALQMMRDAGREDLVPAEETELEILRAYLPRMMDDAEITELAKEVIAETGAASPADMGQVMGALMPRVKGKADGRVVSQIVRQLLVE